MKAILVATLLIFSMAAVAGGNNNKKGSDEEVWLGDSREEDYARKQVVVSPWETFTDQDSDPADRDSGRIDADDDGVTDNL